MAEHIDYSHPGPLTDLGAISPEALASVAGEPVDICWPSHWLVIQPGEAERLGLPSERFSENQIRPAVKLVETLLALDAAPLTEPREPSKRVIGTCRHFAVMSCALLRYRGIPARVRCGFATYFQPGQGLDHWITEYWSQDEGRWIRIDSEILGQHVPSHPEDLRPGEFFSGGEAWTAFRQGSIDASTFGVYGTENWGVGEIRGNAVKDLAALNKIEMLPWDEWGQMEAAYKSETNEAYDEMLDDLATVCAGDDLAAVTKFYAREDLRVPPELIR